MSNITTNTVSPVSGTSVSIGGDLSVYSDFSCGGLTLSSGKITVLGQSVFQSGFTSASLLTCNAIPVSSDHLVTKDYVDDLLTSNRLYYCSSVDGSATETITLEPGNYTIYAEITGVIDCSVAGAITVTGSFSWPAGSVGAISTISTQRGSVRYFDSVIVPIKISNVNLTTTASGTYSYSLTASIGSVYSKDTCTVYVIKNS
jgi:hypothetical protein